MAHKTQLPAHLHDIRKRIEGFAREYGLDFFDTIFEILTYDQMNEIAAYGGFPNRYPHWRFGMEYEQLVEELRVRPLEDLRDGHQQQPLVRVPARGQLVTDQKLVMAHVYGHVDFFKNNFCFRSTTEPRTMIGPDGEPRRRAVAAGYHGHARRGASRSRTSSTSASRSRT